MIYEGNIIRPTIVKIKRKKVKNGVRIEEFKFYSCDCISGIQTWPRKHEFSDFGVNEKNGK